MKSLKIALLQLLPCKTTKENLAKGMEACRKAKEMGADIALLPEMWSVGYSIPSDISALKSTAIGRDSDFVEEFGKLAKEINMAIAVPYLEAFEPLPRNTVTVFDCKGNRAFDYAKVHTCDFGYECVLYPGEDFYVEDTPVEKHIIEKVTVELNGYVVPEVVKMEHDWLPPTWK